MPAGSLATVPDPAPDRATVDACLVTSRSASRYPDRQSLATVQAMTLTGACMFA